LACRIEGETKWKFEGKPNPYDAEIKALLDSVRSGNPINSGYHMANSTLACVMGQISCYTGKEVTWSRRTTATSATSRNRRTARTTWNRR